MGLQISNIVEKKEITFEQLRGKIIAVDAFNTLYQFLSNIRQMDGTPLMDFHGKITSHLSGLFYRTTNLLMRGLKLVFVFDGTPPALKYGTKEKREALKDKAREKYAQAKEKGREEEMGKYAKQFATLNEEVITESKELIRALGLPSIQAPSEGESQASFMVKQEDAYAVASQDYDSLLFGAPNLIQNLTLSRKRRLATGAFITIQPEIIELEKLLKTLRIDQKQLISLGILVGTDYNPHGIKGIGPKKALEIVRQYKKPLSIFKAAEQQQPLGFDWQEIFNLFKKPDVTKKYNIQFKKPNEQAIKKLLVEKHDFSAQRIDNALAKLQKYRASQQQALGKWF